VRKKFFAKEKSHPIGWQKQHTPTLCEPSVMLTFAVPEMRMLAVRFAAFRPRHQPFCSLHPPPAALANGYHRLRVNAQSGKHDY
jgi:hypothetical protein